MTPKAKKDTPAPPKAKAKAKAKALKAKKAVLKGIQSHTHTHTNTHTHKLRMSPTSGRLKTLWLWRQPKYPQKSAPKRNNLGHTALIRFSPTAESVMKKREDNNTPVHIGHVKPTSTRPTGL